MSAIEKLGSNLKFVADPDLLEDEETIAATCLLDGSGLLQFVREKSELLKTMLKRENLKTFYFQRQRGWPFSTNLPGRATRWMRTLSRLRQNAGFLTFVSPQLIASQEGLKYASSRPYLKLPRELKANKELGLEVLTSESLDETTADRIVSCIVALLEETTLMLCMARHGYHAVFSCRRRDLGKGDLIALIVEICCLLIL